MDTFIIDAIPALILNTLEGYSVTVDILSRRIIKSSSLVNLVGLKVTHLKENGNGHYEAILSSPQERPLLPHMNGETLEFLFRLAKKIRPILREEPTMITTDFIKNAALKNRKHSQPKPISKNKVKGNDNLNRLELAMRLRNLKGGDFLAAINEIF